MMHIILFDLKTTPFSFELDPSSIELEPSVNTFYTRTEDRSISDWNITERQNFELCAKMRYIMKNYLAFEYNNFKRKSSYMGFDSGGFCAHPT